MLMSATDSRVVTVPVKTQWGPTTASASPALSSLTTTTAWVGIISWGPQNAPFSVAVLHLDT